MLLLTDEEKEYFKKICMRQKTHKDRKEFDRCLYLALKYALSINTNNNIIYK